MKVTKLETIFVKPRWLFLKMHTDEGIVGLGEPILEGRTQTCATAVQEIGRWLIGQDPTRIEHNWQAIYRWAFYRGGPILTSALSGVEQAMWDIMGKWLGQPVYKLLGGPTRDRIRVYRGAGGQTPEECAASAKAAVKDGFFTLKTGLPGGTLKYTDIGSGRKAALTSGMGTRFVEPPIFIEQAVANFAAMREAAGKEADIAVDFHGRISPAFAIQLCKALEPYHPMFIEEPVLPHNADELARVARSTSIPIATGERLMTKWQFREILEKQAAAILQPDLSHAGGISETKKIAAMSECYYGAIAPHCPLGPIALAACIHLDASIPNFLSQELGGLGDGYLKNPFKVVNGYIELPTGPGLGVELDEDALADKIYAGDWENPQLYQEDGSVADW